MRTMLRSNWLRRKTLLLIFFTVLANRFHERGLRWFIRGLVKRIAIELCWLALLPITLLLHAMGYRRLIVCTEHIGHLAAELDTFFKEKTLGLISKKHWFLLAPPGRIANLHLLSYWQTLVPVVTHRWGIFFLEVMSRRWLLREDLSRYINRFFGTQEIYTINRLWGTRPPILTLSPDDVKWGRRSLLELGIPNGQWFVCVHVREGGFLPHNELIQSHRNADIHAAIPAMQEIVRRGGKVVRVGDSTMTRLPAIPGVIDYAHHPIKSERMDVILCAKARFFVGCTSGLAFLATTFGVPVAHANMIPVETLGIRHGDLSIPKLLWSKRLERYLSYEKALACEVGGYFFSQQYEEAEIEVKENDAEDILALVREMLDRLDGKFIEDEEGKYLHDYYMSLFKPGHYSFGACSRICLGFLHRHRNLLDAAPYYVEKRNQRYNIATL